MKRNAVRIVCNPYTNHISYFFRNELGEWKILTGSSPLSRQYYTRTSIKERHKDIIQKLDEIYNRKNKGLDIYFEGTSINYNYIAGAIKTYLPDRDIVCKPRMTKIAVVGKKASGKSTLIEEIANEKGYKFETVKKDQYVQYIDKSNNINWIELNGIDFGENEILRATSTIQDLVKDDLSTVIYCISSDSGRIEDTEKNFIENINTTFSEITVLTVLTNCYKEDVQKVINEVEKLTNHMKVFPVLAKEYKTSDKARGMVAPYIVVPFGIKELCAFVFEGKKLPSQFQDELKSATTYIEQKQDTCDKGLKEKKTVDTSSVQEKRSDLVSIKQPKSIETGKSTPVSSVKETKSVDISEKKQVFKKIAIVGKKATGKTTLIEGIETYVRQPFNKENLRNYAVYEDMKSNMQWYEVKGIDLGRDKIEEAYTTVKGLIADGVKTIFYCVSGGVGRIEDSEKNLIRRLTTEYPHVSIVVVLTMCYKEDLEDTINEIKKIAGKSEIIQTLAKDYKTGIRIPQTGQSLIVSSFGLDLVYRRAKGDK